jgi:hypothetical protein
LVALLEVSAVGREVTADDAEANVLETHRDGLCGGCFWM